MIKKKKKRPIGNYDINVIMWALDTRGKEMQWFDNRHLESKNKNKVLNIYLY